MARLSWNPGCSEHLASKLMLERILGKTVGQPAHSTSLYAHHLGLDSWLSIVPSGMPDTREVSESKKHP